jgi:hypothetical protein
MRKSIPGYEGLYSADVEGHIWRDEQIIELKARTKTRPARMMNPSKPDMTRGGYLRVTLTDSCGRSKAHSVHRLVASAFHPNPHNKRTVNHKDGNHLNNKQDNLEWATDKENNAHAWANGLRKNGRKTVPAAEKEAMRYMFLKGKSVAEIARHFKRQRSVVQDNTKDLRESV